MQGELLKPHVLKVFSSFFSNISAAWFLTALIASSPLVIATNVSFFIMALFIAIKLEGMVRRI